MDHDRRARHRFSPGVEYAADDEHPPGSRGRIGVIRLRGCRWRTGRGNFRLIAPRRIGRTGGDGGEGQQRQGDGSWLAAQHGSEHLLGKGRRRGLADTRSLTNVACNL